MINAWIHPQSIQSIHPSTHPWMHLQSISPSIQPIHESIYNPSVHPFNPPMNPSTIYPVHPSIHPFNPPMIPPIQTIHNQFINPSNPSIGYPSIHPSVDKCEEDWFGNGQKKGRKARQHARRQKEPLGAIRYKGDGGVWWGVLRSNLLLELELSQIAHLNGKKRHGDDDDDELVGCCCCCCGILITILIAIPIFLLACLINFTTSFFLSFVRGFIILCDLVVVFFLCCCWFRLSFSFSLLLLDPLFLSFFSCDMSCFYFCFPFSCFSLH